jgi:hypothetical protein
MQTKNIFIAFVVVVAIIAGVLILNKKTKVNKTIVPSAPSTVQQKIESKFLGITIPTDAERIELKDISGGVGMGIATRTEILADLPDLPSGKFYQGWLENISGKKVLLGIFSMAKGGWILTYNSSSYPGYNKVIVTQGEIHILEGSF